VLLGFGPLVDHWGVGFGPWWTGKNRPLQHTIREVSIGKGLYGTLKHLQG
jgi:hypothetical protein